MITLIKAIFYIYKVIFELVLIVVSSYFIILRYLFTFVNDVLKIKLNKRKEVKENESKSNKKTGTR